MPAPACRCAGVSVRSLPLSGTAPGAVEKCRQLCNTVGMMKKTIKLYDNTPYADEFDAVILDVQPAQRENLAAVVLDATLFFPEEGGQTPDQGLLAGFPVADVQIEADGCITHFLELPPHTAPDAVLRAGETVHGQLNWAHRFSNMQNHSGEHILSGLLHRRYGYENVGFRLSEHTVTLDTAGELTAEQVQELEQEANAAVWRNLPVHCTYPPAEELEKLSYRSKKAVDGPVRIVSIEGIDMCACCAPHVARTGEIGLIKILSAEKNRSATRLTFLCGGRALAEMQRRQEELLRVSHLIHEPVETVSCGVQKRLDEIYALKGSLYRKELQYIDARLAALPPGDASSDIYLFENDLSPRAQRELMNRLCEQGGRYAGVFAGSDTDGWKYLIGSRTADARIPGALLVRELGARGGGKSDMVQGSLHAAADRIRQVLGNASV